jgi:hypothetical protein
MVDRGHLQLRGDPAQAVASHDRFEGRVVAREREDRVMHHAVDVHRRDHPHPHHLGLGRGGIRAQIDRVGHVTDVDGDLRRPVPGHRMVDAVERVGQGGQVLRFRCQWGPVLVLESLLLLLERGRRGEDGARALGGVHLPCGERAAVAQVLHLETDGQIGVPGGQEVGVHGVHPSAGGDRAAGRDDRLAHHLATEDVPTGHGPGLPLEQRVHRGGDGIGTGRLLRSGPGGRTCGQVTQVQEFEQLGRDGGGSVHAPIVRRIMRTTCSGADLAWSHA